ncbi:hypothetical protein L484_017085 [Morus notabilis]|uniref:Transmembrane protein 135 N-terminal domain-containing protein n=2 Tax=Morus notabilis TaxID=981085 RepID=W9S1L8_9ROSA|nr:hypothetical protein L484_017085 [Morus notabilis]
MANETPSSPPSPPLADSSDAERRLREAEDRLREAMEELQRRQRRAAACGPPHHPPCHHAGDESCVANAIGNLCQSFLLSYGVRVGIGILLRAFKLARRQSYSSLLDLKQLVSEKDLIVREEACRIGLFFGGFTGSYHALRCLLRKLRKKETPLNSILAGSVAALSILALDDSNRRRTLALYLLARVAQCAYNSAKSKNKFHLWGSHWSHGDSLLFAFACAQVMYAFVMRPETLPKAYQDFIQKTGPVAQPVYKAVRDCCRGFPVDFASLSAFLSDKKNSNHAKLEEFPSIIPCSVIHPDTSSCLAHNANATSATFRKTFPLYFSLTFVPFVVLHLQKFKDAPARTCWLALKGAVRSTAFLSAFVGIFQGAICLHRKVAPKDHKLVYWIAGGISALSVLIEKKARRSELALYVLPRAGDSLWYILVNRHLLPDIKNAEVFLFCMCMGGIMYYLEHEPDTMAPFLRGLIRRFLASRMSNPSPPPNRNASYTYLTLDVMNKPKLQEGQDAKASPSAKYNLESIPGLVVNEAQIFGFLTMVSEHRFLADMLHRQGWWRLDLILGLFVWNEAFQSFAVAVHFEAEALTWFQSEDRRWPFWSWSEFKTHLLQRFRPVQKISVLAKTVEAIHGKLDRLDQLMHRQEELVEGERTTWAEWRPDLEIPRQRPTLERVRRDLGSREADEDLSGSSRSGARSARFEVNGGGFATKSENAVAIGSDISRSSKIEARSGSFGASSSTAEVGLGDLAAVWTGPRNSGVKGAGSGATEADSGGIGVGPMNSDALKVGFCDFDAIGDSSGEMMARTWNSDAKSGDFGAESRNSVRKWVGSSVFGMGRVNFGVGPRNYNVNWPNSGAMVLGPQNSSTFRTGYSKSVAGYDEIGDREAERMKT